MGLYVPFFYVQTFAISHNILDEDEAFYMLTILNATSFFGRLFPNYLADKIGPLNVLVPSTLVAALLAFCFIAVKTKAGLIALCVFYGFFSGTFVSVPPTVMVTITKNMGVLGTRMGLAFAIAGMGLLVGNPIAGVIVDQGNFPGAWAFSGAALLLSVFFNSCARIAKTGYKLNVIA
jgi:MFS family permease